MVAGLPGAGAFGFSSGFEMKDLQSAYLPNTGKAEGTKASKFALGGLEGPGSSAAELSQHFGDTLKTELEKVNTIQTHAQQMTEDYAAGKDVALHQVMISMNRADTSMQLATQVRNRMVSAYQDISRMQL